jgi:hypothetical protein
VNIISAMQSSGHVKIFCSEQQQVHAAEKKLEGTLLPIGACATLLLIIEIKKCEALLVCSRISFIRSLKKTM